MCQEGPRIAAALDGAVHGYVQEGLMRESEDRLEIVCNLWRKGQGGFYVREVTAHFGGFGWKK